jgi:hypothetical protein
MPGPVSPGLCVSCQHAETITSDRGSKFLFCGLSRIDPQFPKYPRLPVFSCSGWKPDSSSPVAQLEQ